MKKKILTMLAILAVLLTACTGNTSSTAGAASEPSVTQAVVTEAPAVTEATASEGTTPTGLNTSYENAVSVEQQLLLGTLKLDGTDLAITEEQAKTLLPLWNDLKTLTQSMAPGQGQGQGGPGQAPGQGQGNATPQAPDQSQGNGTPQEPGVNSEMQTQIDALVQQITAAMTSEQIQAIADMKITQDMAMTMMQEQGITTGDPGQGNQPPQGTPQAGNGQQPMGTPPDANGQQPQGTPGAGNGQMAGPQGGGQGFGGGMVSSELLDAVIKLLEKISGIQASINTQPAAAQAAGSITTSAAYILDGGKDVKTDQTYSAMATDESAVYVTNAGVLTLGNSVLTSSGDSSSSDNSSFYGLNAVVLAEAGGVITLSNSSVNSSGAGANGVFATGAGSNITLADVTIQCTGQYAHGVDATLGGSLTLTNVNISTAGANSGAIATDRGSGTITATGGTVITSGQDSPGIYSTGLITVSDATISASGAEAAVIEGANSILLTNTTLSTSMDNKWGVMIYQSMSGDAEGTEGIFTMTGGSLADTAANGALFYVTNSTGIITLKNVAVTSVSGTLLNASADRWGNNGSNGGTVKFTADGQILNGNMIADAISSISVTLQNNSSLTGAINSVHTAKAANLTLDESSTWNVTADSYLTCLTDSSGISGTTVNNVIGNGFTVYYDRNVCSELGGLTYSLSGGGTLTPVR